MLDARLQARQEAAERQEEERYRQQLMARFAEEDRVEQMNAQKRRLCIEQHKREAARLIAEKQALTAAAKASILKFAGQSRSLSLLPSMHVEVLNLTPLCLFGLVASSH